MSDETTRDAAPRNALRYVESLDTYSIYLDDRGGEVLLAHGPGLRRLTPFEDIDLAKSWQQYSLTGPVSRQDWLDTLENAITEPEAVEDIVWCDNCTEPMHTDDAYEVAGGEVCESCYVQYTTCDRCDDKVRHTSTTLSDAEVCEGCRDSYYSFCDDCDGWYEDADADDHRHGIGCCESPAMQFSVRNDGEAPLSDDERVTISLPAGVITIEGLQEIARHLSYVAVELEDSEQASGLYELAHYDVLMSTIGSSWQTREGNFTKRLSRYAYKTHGLKLSPDVISRIGCIARDHSTAVDFDLEVTRNLNLSDDDFGNSGSCWWQSYSESRCALKTNGGYGLRTFEAGTDYVSGRAWVMPLRRDQAGRLLPTFDTGSDAFVVFNGYGVLSGYVGARIVAHMAGMTYRKVVFDCSPMYVNGESGYLIAAEEIAQPYTDGRLSMSVDQHSDLFETERKELANVA